MATVAHNLEYWEKDYSWDVSGEEWSDAWGGSEMQWWGSLFPRIQSFLPTGHILEIAPGFGRWTRFLKDQCEKLTIIDLTPRCIEHCQRRFARETHIDYIVNDGKSLAMIPDGSVDFVFSFDSLVHAEADVLTTYLKQLARKLKPDGAGFIHHSNAARYQTYFSLLHKLPRGRHFLTRNGLVANDCARGISMSAASFERDCAASGLQCIGQEVMNWHGSWLIDCMSTFTRQGARWERPNTVLENPHFMQEARLLANLAKLYAREPRRNPSQQPPAPASR